MANPHVVRVDDLRTAVDRALSLAAELLGPEVALDVDYYWNVPVEAAFDLCTEPQTLTVGQLSDDLAEAVYDDHPREPREASHALSHVIGLLRALELSTRS